MTEDEVVWRDSEGMIDKDEYDPRVWLGPKAKRPGPKSKRRNPSSTAKAAEARGAVLGGEERTPRRSDSRDARRGVAGSAAMGGGFRLTGTTAGGQTVVGGFSF